MAQKLVNVHPNAKISEGVVIEPFATIHEDVEIDSGCWIGPNAVIMNGARIGKNCKIHAGAVIAGEPQDLKYEGEETIVEIGDNTVIREFVTINKGTKAKGKTIVGKNCLIMSYVHIAHDSHLKDQIIMGSYSGVAGEVEVDSWAIISPGALVHQFVRIGPYSMIQGNCKVTKDIPPYIMAGRDPIAYTGINSVGLRRRKFENETIYAIQDIYRIIYQRGLNVTDAVNFAETSLPPSNERDVVIQFIRNSKRGIIRGYFDSKNGE